MHCTEQTTVGRRRASAVLRVSTCSRQSGTETLGKSQLDIFRTMAWFILRSTTNQPYVGSWLWLVLLVSSFTTSKTSLTFLQHPTSQTVQQGGHVTLNCTVSAQRRISYEWKHNNKTIRTNKQSRFTITSDGSLRITNADLDDSGIYQCTAILTTKRSHTVRKKARSHTAKLTVEGMCNKAEIVTRPVHTTKFTAGKEFSLRCRCRSSSIGTVRWIKNADTVIPVEGRISMDQRRLSINGTSFADSGNYTCYVTIDKLGTAKSEKLEVWVGKKPQIIRPPPTSSPAVKGFAMSLNCLATGTPPPMVRWYYIGPIWSEHVKKSIKNDSTYSVYQNGTLIIRNVEARETGFYECTASNLMGRTTRKCKVYIPVKFITKPKNTTVAIGKSTVLRCNATGTPEPTITWVKEQGGMDKKRLKQLANGNLHIRDARMADAGHYFCIAANMGDLKEVQVSLRVIESNVVKLSHSHKHSIEAFLGSRRKITCEFHGIPPIKVTWSKKGSDELPARAENHGNSLVIKKVALTDAGQYICNGSNAFSSETAYVNVSVYDPLRFLHEPENQAAFIGESVWFHCAATGSPQPKITWLKYDQGRRPLDAEKYKVHKNGSLNIRNVTSSDRGRYFCIAATRVDLRQKTVHLFVKEHPTKDDAGPIQVAASNSAHKAYSFKFMVEIVSSTVLSTMANVHFR